MARYWYTWKVTFSNFVFETKPHVILTCMNEIALFVRPGSYFRVRASFVHDCTFVRGLGMQYEEKLGWNVLLTIKVAR